MKNILLFINILLLQSFLLTGFANADRGIQVILQPTGSRIALIIGNSEYQTAPLKNPAHDAKDIGAVLGKRGFDVILKLNADKRTMEEAIQTFGKKLGKGGVGLFYYAGHGMQVGGRNYLIPTGSKIETESDVKYEGVDAGRVLGKMEDAGNDLNIVILDACRNNPFARSFRSSEKGLARMDAPKGSLVAYATSPGATAADGDGRNGVYTKHLIKNIQKSDLTIEEILKQVRIAVIAETGNSQVPWESSSLVGNFFFNIQEVHIEQKAKVEGQATIDAEEEFWLSIKGSKLADDWRMYLTEYPEGRFAAIARLQLKRLKVSEPSLKEGKSLMGGTWEAWQEGKTTNTIRKDKDNNRVWDYSIAKVNDDDYICISQDSDAFSVKGKQIRLSLSPGWAYRFYSICTLLFPDTPQKKTKTVRCLRVPLFPLWSAKTIFLLI